MILIVGIVLLASNLSFALEGELRGVLSIWDSPFRVTGHLTVPAGDSLTIDPGVVLQFAGLYKFNVYGTLIAVGTQKDTIRFEHLFLTVGGWDGIRFEGSAGGVSKLQYCRVMNGMRAIGIAGGANPRISNSRILDSKSGIIITSSKGVIEQCHISATDGTGILVEGSSNTIIRNNWIFDCFVNGVIVTETAKASVDSNYISVNKIGIRVSTTQACSLKWNQVMSCGDHGINLGTTNGTVLYRNIISRSDGNYGIEVNRANNTHLIGNTVADNVITGIHIYASNGVRVMNNVSINNGRHGIECQTATPQMLNNLFHGNRQTNYTGVEAGETDLQVPPVFDMEYWPFEGSPVIDVGNGIAPRDPDGTPPDIGARFFNQNLPPVITDFQPEILDNAEGLVDINFSVTAMDPEGKQLYYRWYLNGVKQGETQSAYTYTPTSDGKFNLVVVVDDKLYLGTDSVMWAFFVGVPEEETAVPVQFSVAEPYPNPFNATTNISFILPSRGNVTVELNDLAGSRVSTLYSGEMGAGKQSIILNGDQLSTGVYILTVRSPFGVQNKKVVLLK